MPSTLNIITFAAFAANLSLRALDPVLPQIAGEFVVSIGTAAAISSAFAFTFAIIQPLLGAAADLFGKTRLMSACMALIGIASIFGAISSSFSILFATRILAGIGAGGVFPITLGLISDLVAPGKRQVAIGRMLAGAMTGNLLGATLSGLIGDFVGWRGVLFLIGGLVLLAAIAVTVGLRGPELKPPARTDLTALKAGYRTIFSNPNVVCYLAVFIEGCCVFGVFPFVASFLLETGETRLSIAGIVIAGFAIGGLFYTAMVSRLLELLGVNGMMIAGGVIVALQLAATAFGPDWKIQLFIFILMGLGFYTIHGCLQMFASELSARARATALSLHSCCFFMGQSLGAVSYGFGIQSLGKTSVLMASAVTMFVLGLACARLLKSIPPPDSAITRR